MFLPAPPRFPSYGIVIAVAVVVSLPMLGFGFFVDDYMFFATLEGWNPLGTPLDLYRFGTGNPDDMQAMMESGPYPWFGDPEFKAHFFRPIASALMTLDHALFHRWTPGYNAHSLLWRLLMCLGAWRVFRRTLPHAVGVTALLLLAVDESHVLPAAWWSNRHAIIAMAAGYAGLAAHLRLREEGWRPGLPVSLVLLLAALLASELGLGVLAYIPAYEMFGRRGPLRNRILAVLPAASLAAAYYAFYRFSGYGTGLSDVYVDPGSDLSGYLGVAPGRFAMLAGVQFLMLPVEAILFWPRLEIVFVLLGCVALAAVGIAMRALWPRLDPAERQTLRWMMPGAALAALPGLASIVNGRVLLPASLGGAAIIAVIAVHGWRSLQHGAAPPLRLRTRRALRWVLVAFVAGHTVFAALSWPAQTAGLRAVTHHLNGLMRSAELDETRLEHSQVVLLNAFDPYTALYPLMLRRFEGRAVPRSWWTISYAPFPHRLRRVGERELELEVVDGEMLTTVMERLFRSANRPLEPGDMRDLNGLRVIVLETGRQGPKKVRLEFEEAPESDRYQLLAFQDGGYRRIRPPEPGQTLEFDAGFRSAALWMCAHLPGQCPAFAAVGRQSP